MKQAGKNSFVGSKVYGVGNKTYFLLLAFTLYSLPLTLHAAFDDVGTGARPAALGGSYVALGEDSQSLMYNPAGLANLSTKEVTTEYSKLLNGLSDGSNINHFYTGYAHPVEKLNSTFAIGVKQLSLQGFYTERTLSLGYARKINEKVTLGAAFKQLHFGVNVPQTIVNNSGSVTYGTPDFFARYGSGKSAYSGDLGVLYKLNLRTLIGASIQDINEPNLALSDTDTTRQNRMYRLGAAYKGKKGWVLAGAVASRKNLEGTMDNNLTFGTEKWWRTPKAGSFAARGSYTQGNRSLKQTAMGAGYRYRGIQVDYTYVFNIGGLKVGDSGGSHRVSMGYRFGPTPEEQYVDVLELVNRPFAMNDRDAKGEEYDWYAVDFWGKKSLDELFENIQVFLRKSNRDLPELMDAMGSMEDASTYYEENKGQPDYKRRMSRLLRDLEINLQNAMTRRSWDMADARDNRYKAWLRRAWLFNDYAVNRSASPKNRIELLNEILHKATDFENMPPEPITVPTKPTKEVMDESYKQYLQMVSNGATAGEQLQTLQQLLSDCEQAQIDCKDIRDEIHRIFDKEVKLIKDMNTAWTNYRGLIKKNASAEERAKYLQQLLSQDETQTPAPGTEKK